MTVEAWIVLPVLIGGVIALIVAVGIATYPESAKKQAERDRATEALTRLACDTHRAAMEHRATGAGHDSR